MRRAARAPKQYAFDDSETSHDEGEEGHGTPKKQPLRMEESDEFNAEESSDDDDAAAGQESSGACIETTVNEDGRAAAASRLKPRHGVKDICASTTAEIAERATALWGAISWWQKTNARKRLRHAEGPQSILRLVSGTQLEFATLASTASPLQRLNTATGFVPDRDAARLARAKTLVSLKILSERDSNYEEHGWSAALNPGLLIEHRAKDGYVHGSAGATAGRAVIPACSQRMASDMDAFYVKGVELRSLGVIYVAIRGNGGDDRGLPAWQGTGHNDRLMLEKLHSAGVCGWKLCTPVSVPLYWRKRGKGFEVFAVMRVQRVLHTAFLAEILPGGMRVWYFGRVATSNKIDGAKMYSACMVGEFLLLRNPLAVPTQPQHVLATESGLSTLVMRGGGKTKPARKKTSARKPASELAREKASTGEPASV